MDKTETAPEIHKKDRVAPVGNARSNLSVTELHRNDVGVYPNPATGIIHVSSPGKENGPAPKWIKN